MLKLLNPGGFLTPTRRNIALAITALITVLIFWKLIMGLLKLVITLTLIGALAYAGWRLFLRPSPPA
jgi:hypothetical protein